MSVTIDSGVGFAYLDALPDALPDTLTGSTSDAQSGKQEHPDFDVAVTSRLLVMVMVMVTLAATGLFLYGQVSPGI